MEKRLWTCPKVPFQGHHQEISRSDQESWALRIFCKPLAQLWHYGAWIFPTCFNTITNPENDNVLICHSSTVSWFIWSLEGGHHAPKRFGLWNLVPTHSVLALAISLRLAVFFRRRTASFGQPDLLWSDRIILKWTLWYQQKNHPDFPFLLGTISMYQWMKCTPPMKTKENCIPLRLDLVGSDVSFPSTQLETNSDFAPEVLGRTVGCCPEACDPWGWGQRLACRWLQDPRSHPGVGNSLKFQGWRLAPHFFKSYLSRKTQRNA